MSLLIELSPETEARLKAEAEAQNVQVSEIIQRLVEQSAFATASNTPNNATNQPPRRWRNIMDFEGIFASDKPVRDAQERINELRDEWDAPIRTGKS